MFTRFEQPPPGCRTGQNGRPDALDLAPLLADGTDVSALIVPFLAACALLLLAGLAKLRTPAATAQALRTQGLPSSPGLVRLLGAAEVALAVAAAAGVPGTALGVAAGYAAFTGVVLLPLLRGRPLSSCGCFGEPDLPPTPVHVVLTALAAACALAVALTGGAGLPEVSADGAGAAAAVLGATALATWLGVLVLTALARLALARTPPAQPARALAAPRELTLTPARRLTTSGSARP